MTAKIIDGKAIAAVVEGRIQAAIIELNIKPVLAVILVGYNDASEVYVKKKRQACEGVGIESRIYRLDGKSERELLELCHLLSEDEEVNGILVQLPLPVNFDFFKVFEAINPLKDVDVFHPENVGLLVQGRPRFLPCTPHGIQKMLNMSGLSLSEKHVVVINRSNVVGKPLSSMLIQDNDEYANATVTVCHDRTLPTELKKLCLSADIIVVAVGIPNFLTTDLVKEHQIIVDVGITRIGKRIVGDAHPGIMDKVAWITPVPGGCGPMTVACLLENTLLATKIQNGIE